MIRFELWLEAMSEKEALKSPESAYRYTVHVINKRNRIFGQATTIRWPEGEPIIATEPEFVYRYARYVIGGRWPEGEAAIAKDLYWAYQYVMDVLKNKRFPEGEAVILKDPKTAYYYAHYVIDGRWLEAEPIISKDPKLASEYMKFVLETVTDQI